jgi:hypothetical protein
MVVDMDITFPRVPCYRKSGGSSLVGTNKGTQLRCAAGCIVLSLDVMDISGEHQLDLKHEIVKSRLDKNGNVVGVIKDGRKSSPPSLSSYPPLQGHPDSVFSSLSSRLA